MANFIGGEKKGGKYENNLASSGQRELEKRGAVSFRVTLGE